MTAFFAIVIFTLPDADNKTLHRVRSALLRTGLEDVILGMDEHNYTLPNENILVGEFMAENVRQCRKILRKKIHRIMREANLPTQCRMVVGVCSRAEWTVQDISSPALHTPDTKVSSHHQGVSR